jgi:hypothetical protein
VRSRLADAAGWLARARAGFDDPATGLAAAAGSARFGFHDGARWMAMALGCPRTDVAPAGYWWRLGLGKYGLATAPALATAVMAWAWLPALLPLAIVVFYAVEARMVFAFPLALHGHAAPLRQSHRLLRATAGSAWATWQVMRIAAVMLFGGIGGGGARRSWCIGCLAVVEWYRDARLRAGT